MRLTISAIALFLLPQLLLSQSITGVWKTIDDEDGTAKSHITIEESNGKLTGTVTELLEGATLTICENCKGARKNQPIKGMKILWDLEPNGAGEASGGTVFDPGKGKDYSCKVKLEGDDQLIVRGYVGIPALGRSQTWYRVK